MLFNDKEWLIDIQTYNPELLKGGDLYRNWVSQISNFVDKDIIALIK